jgi:hypothetical protein
MRGSIRDQLLALGFKPYTLTPTLKPEPKTKVTLFVHELGQPDQEGMATLHRNHGQLDPYGSMLQGKNRKFKFKYIDHRVPSNQIRDHFYSAWDGCKAVSMPPKYAAAMVH